MDIVETAQGADLEPYLVDRINKARNQAQRNGVMLLGTILLLVGVIVVLITNLAPDVLGIGPLALPFGLDRLIPEESRNSILFGAAAPLVTAAGRFVDQIAGARRERLTLIYTRYLLMLGEKEQASRILLTSAMGASGSSNSGFIEYLILTKGT